MTSFFRLALCLLALSCCWSVESPFDPEVVQQVIERSKQNPEILRELRGAPLDLTMKPLWRIYSMGRFTVTQRELAKKTGEEQEWLKTEAIAGRDPDYLAKAYPIAWEIVTNHPDFEWTVGSKLTEMTFILNEGRTNRSIRNGEPYAEANSYYGDQMHFAIRAPGDMAFRLLGPCLFSPYYPTLNHGDTTSNSPATHARWALAGLLKERYGEKLPEDIEAARAWWKANEHRFAEKESAAPKNQHASKTSPTDAKGELATSPKSQSAEGSPHPPDSHSEPDTPSHPSGRTATIGVFAALLLAIVWFFFKKQ